MPSARVLLLSRRVAFLEPLTQAFEKAGIDVKNAGDAVEGAAVFLDESLAVPAGAVVDLLTVDDDASDLCARVRERKDAESVPILFIGTGQESIRSTTDALIAGGDGFFQLPVEAPRVVAKVAAYLGMPVPTLPHGLLVTIDDHDLLERTPEPTRIVVPAALPEDLLGDDDHERTPPGGTAVPDDFADTTTPFARGQTLAGLPTLGRGPASAEGEPSPVAGDDADALLEEHARHEAEEAARLAREAAAVAAVADAAVADDDAERADKVRAEEEALTNARLVAEQAREQERRAEDDRRARAEAFAAAEAERRAALQTLEEERVLAEVRAQTLAELRAEEEARLRALQEEARRTEELLRAQADEQRRLVAEEEARLQRVLAERQRAEAEALEADARKEEELKAEERRVEALVEKRKRLEEETAHFHTEQEQQRKAEEDRLAAVAARRAALEQEAARLADEAERQKRESAAELEILAARRAEEEAALAALEEQHQQRQQQEEQSLSALRERRRALEDAERKAEEERARRLADEEQKLQELVAARTRALAEQQQQAQRDEEERQKRIAAEEARLFELKQERERAWAEAQLRDALAEEERQRRLLEVEERLASLTRERERLAADQEAQRAALSAAEEAERGRLAALEIARQRADEELQQARAAAAARVDEEEARLRALRDEHARKEREAQQMLEEQRRLARDEQERLEVLARERKALEQKTAELSKRAADDEMLARARLAEIEIARLRAEEAAEQERIAHEQRAEEAAAVVAAVEEERRKIEAAAAARARAAKAAAAAEEARLQRLLAEREAREAELKRLEEQAQAQLLAEERRLRELVERSEAERAAAARDAVRLENDLKVRAAIAEQKLAELAAEQERLVEHAAREAERLALLRAEEEAARKELEDNRARARLAFVSGRFDAVRDRGVGADVVAASDVGSDARDAAEFEGRVFGAGAFARVDPDQQEPPPPLPFVAPEPRDGRFDDGELPALLLSAHALKVTGAVVIVAEDGRSRTLFLEEGEPVFVASALSSDRAEELLLRSGLITAARHAELRAGPPMSARRMCARLVDDGLLKVDELFSAVRGVLTEQLFALLEWSTGSFSFREERAFAADRVRLGHPFTAVVAEGVRRKYDEARLWSVLGGPQTLLGPMQPSSSSVPLPPLSPEETLALSRFDGTRAIDDIILESGLHAHAVLRAALIGVTTGAVTVLARGLPRGPDEAIARRERAVAIDRARVVDRLQLARHGDYFTFLGVDVGATSFEVHRAASKLRERFDPQRYKDSAFADLLGALQEIVDVAGDAESVLADEGLREAYKKNLRQAQAPRLSPKSQAG